MASLPNSKTVTYEEWLRMPEVSDAREEVVDGEIIIMPPAKWIHARIIINLRRALEAQLDADKLLVVDTNFGLIIRKSPLTSRVPDIAVFELATIDERDGYIHSAPLLLVEVLSHANSPREVQRKITDYSSIGVSEVWIVSPDERTVEVLELQNGRLERTLVASEGTLTPRHFPDVHIDISTIWPA